MHSDVTVVICSCDKYEDAWFPFFEMLRIYGGDFAYPIVLNTEQKSYSNAHFDVRVINTPGRATWSERMKNVLSQIETEYIFLLLEDYFLKAPFDHERFGIALEYMRAHEDVGFMDIAPRYASNAEEARAYQKLTDIEDEFFVRENKKFNITLVPSLWRRNVFMDLLRDHEDVWSFEYFSGIRARNSGIKVVRYITRTPTIYEYDFQVWTGMGITRGQWLPKNVTFFEKHGVAVNYDNLGILNVTSLSDIRILNRKSPKVIWNSLKRKIRVFYYRKQSLY